MLRDLDIPTGRYAYRPYILESAKEAQESEKFLPNTEDLPTTHEHHVYREVIERNGKQITRVLVGVREKVKAGSSSSAPTQGEPDNLNALDDGALEVEAAKLGLKNYPKNATKALRVKAIREAREKQPAGV